MIDDMQRLQEKIAHLERHVGEQDKVMLELATRLDLLQRELGLLRVRLTEAKATSAASEDEKPPHY